MNAKKAQLAPATFAGRQIKTIRSTQDSPLSAKEHGDLASHHARVGTILRLNGNMEDAKAHYEAAAFHRTAAEKKASAPPAAPKPPQQAGPPPQSQQPAKQTAPPPPPLTQAHHEFLKQHTSSIDTHRSLNDKQKYEYKQAMRKAVQRMPEAALKRFAAGLQVVHFASDTKEFYDIVASKVIGGDPARVAAFDKTRGAQEMKAGRYGGGYLPNQRQMLLDGQFTQATDVAGARRDSQHEAYAHELTHAIDGPKKELSNHDDWKTAFKEELDQESVTGAKMIGNKKNGRLSWYARTSPEEGFAEFGRLVYGTNTDRGLIEKHFPRCARFFKERGLWQ